MHVVDLRLYAIRPISDLTVRAIKHLDRVTDVKTLGRGNVIQKCPTCGDRKLCNRLIMTVRITFSDDTRDDAIRRTIASAQYKLFRYLHRSEREESSIVVTRVPASTT